MICVLIQCLPVYYLIPPAVPLQWYCAVVRPCCGRVRQLVSGLSETAMAPNATSRSIHSVTEISSCLSAPPIRSSLLSNMNLNTIRVPCATRTKGFPSPSCRWMWPYNYTLAAEIWVHSSTLRGAEVRAEACTTLLASPITTVLVPSEKKRRVRFD